jgi:2-haloacid dehalogenase
MTSEATPVTRRTFLQTSALAMAAGDALHGASAESQRPDGRATRSASFASVKALVFDVFGTVVDWRTSVAREVQAMATRKGLKADGARVADAWRAQYAPMMDQVRTGKLPWTKLDRLHRIIFDSIATDVGLGSLDEGDRRTLNRAWHRLQPWPDSVAGLTRLKKKFILAPLSNGNISLMTDLAKHSGLPWDCILGAELVRHYKPDPEVYQSTFELLDLDRGEVMMVAAHLNDLQAANAQGLLTAFVARPLEYGPNRKPDLAAPPGAVDISAKDFVELAGALGA